MNQEMHSAAVWPGQERLATTIETLAERPTRWAVKQDSPTGAPASRLNPHARTVSSRVRAVVRRRLLVACGVLLSFAQPAHAVIHNLSAASLTIVSGSFSASATWSGTGSADVTGGTITGLTPGIFSLSAVTPAIDPSAFPITGVSYNSITNGAGDFSNVDSAGGGGLMAVYGTQNICLFASCGNATANLVIPFTTDGVSGVGLGGTPIVTIGMVNTTVNGAPWTTGTACVDTLCRSGAPLTEASVTLVTATRVETNIGSLAVVPHFAIMTLTFAAAPEDCGNDRATSFL